MNNSETPSSYRFSSYLLDVAERQLSRNDKPVPLTPKAFDVLVYLVEHSGHLVLKDELMQAVWPDSFVDEVNLPRTIHTLRRALGEDENGGKFIETVPTKGYRFVAKVTEERESQERQAEKMKNCLWLTEIFRRRSMLMDLLSLCCRFQWPNGCPSPKAKRESCFSRSVF